MKYKTGVCSECLNGMEVPLIARLCQYHYRKHRHEVNASKPKKLKVKKSYTIKPISKNRQDALKRYSRLRDKYFEEHPVCEYPGCNSKEITLHHMRGRIGAFLTDKRYFKSLCWTHHKYIEENPTEARKLGLSQLRLSA